MDSSLKNPRLAGIPGPAGETYFLFPPTRPLLSYGYAGSDVGSQNVDARLFVGGAWEAMLEAERMEPYGRTKMCNSVASFKKMVLREEGGKAGRIMVRVMTKEFIGKDARVVLGDITGLVVSTVHSEVFPVMGERIEPGAVLVLQNIGGLICPGSAYTRKVEQSRSVHLIVQLSTIEKVYDASCSPRHASARTSLITGDLQRLKDSSTKKALD